MNSTTASQKRYYSTPIPKKNYTQTVSIVLGCFLIVIALAGILYEEIIGLHMSLMHSLVFFGSGVLCLWAASKRRSKKAFYVDLTLGIFFALNAIAGWVLGIQSMTPEQQHVRDTFLVQWAPGFIELGIVDHVVHSLLAIFFIAGAVSWKKHHKLTGERTY